jgi:hypothetical protein
LVLLGAVEAGFQAMLVDDQPYRKGEMTAETQRNFIIGVAVVAGLVALMNLLAISFCNADRRRRLLASA